MKKIYISLTLLIICLSGYSQNDYCSTALPFCTGTTYNFPAGVNSGGAEAGPNYGCLATQPNPAWYYMLVEDTGPIEFHISTNPDHDVDFVCWGPFTSFTTPCTSDLTATCSSCPNNTDDSTFYPSGNLVDCSYSVSVQEDCHIPNAISGQYYIIMITNYSNMACNIIFEQTNSAAPSHGTMNSAIVNNFFNPEMDNKLFSVYPNPFSKSTTLEFNNPDNTLHTITIFDVTGKEVRVYRDITSDMISIEKDDLRSGVYSIEISGEKTQRGRFVVE